MRYLDLDDPADIENAIDQQFDLTLDDFTSDDSGIEGTVGGLVSFTVDYPVTENLLRTVLDCSERQATGRSALAHWADQVRAVERFSVGVDLYWEATGAELALASFDPGLPDYRPTSPSPDSWTLHEWWRKKIDPVVEHLPLDVTLNVFDQWWNPMDPDLTLAELRALETESALAHGLIGHGIITLSSNDFTSPST
jgi:hypothetical protein